jgi:acyl-CoA thioesterase
MMSRDVRSGKIRRDPFTERLGIHNEIHEDGVCITTHRSSEDESNIYGVVHGALLFAMADVGMGMALAAALPGEPRLGSISITANFISAGKPGLITAKSRVVRRGRAVAFLETEISDGGGSPCARFSGIFHIYSGGGEQAR